MELTLYPNPTGYGFVVVLPGGGYRLRAEHETYPPMEWLSAQGWCTGALPYTVDPSPYPVALVEVLTAVAEVRAGRYGEVHGPVGVLGFSAGGHLAGLAATATEAELAQVADRIGRPVARPDFSLLAYPVVTLGEHTHEGSRDSLLEGIDDPSLVERLSVERRVDESTGPIFIWTTADDEMVPAQNSLLLATACVEHQVPVEFQLYPQGPHGMGMAGSAQVDAAWAAAAVWLKQVRAGVWRRDVTEWHV